MTSNIAVTLESKFAVICTDLNIPKQSQKVAVLMTQKSMDDYTQAKVPVSELIFNPLGLESKSLEDAKKEFAYLSHNCFVVIFNIEGGLLKSIQFDEAVSEERRDAMSKLGKKLLEPTKATICDESGVSLSLIADLKFSPIKVSTFSAEELFKVRNNFLRFVTDDTNDVAKRIFAEKQRAGTLNTYSTIYPPSSSDNSSAGSASSASYASSSVNSSAASAASSPSTSTAASASSSPAAAAAAPKESLFSRIKKMTGNKKA